MGGEAELDDNLQLLIVPESITPSEDVLISISHLIDSTEIHELQNRAPLVLLFDQRSKAFYLNCHIESKTIFKNSDLEAVLDHSETEDYKFNRNIYTDTYAYKLMETDAIIGRSFEDLVVEYDLTYRPATPFKVFGGQHRIKAIGKSSEKGVSAVHGVRVYFNLSLEQKVDIAIANNTSVAVANDLLDRMQEEFLGTDLRNWCQLVGLLEKNQNFADRRNSEGIPTVRVARTFVVNYYLGIKNSKSKEIHNPVVCISGPGVDKNYMGIRDNIKWTDKSLVMAGQEFAKLHRLQRGRLNDGQHIELANKAIHLCVAASWAYAAGLFQSNSAALVNHYSLGDPTLTKTDPLDAGHLMKARLKGVDPDTYRGLGARISGEEMGRVLELFILQATKASKRGINLNLANTAIKSYYAKKAKSFAEKAIKGI